jgi:hypothetical protein
MSQNPRDEAIDRTVEEIERTLGERLDLYQRIDLATVLERFAAEAESRSRQQPW